MDEDDTEREFSKGIVLNFFEQADTTLTEMNEKLATGDLAALSRLGHFLKGSSGALGLSKVRLSCEKIQHLGNLRDETGSFNISEADALRIVADVIQRLRAEQAEAEGYLRQFYEGQL
ncbi:hypothetical protein HDU96_008060 [Phlyctochytrium bullatum]|nr:hypothetical protein HDU96_008060 [Phlyctochytrium bullatum]